jgi:hypothetical protein
MSAPRRASVRGLIADHDRRQSLVAKADAWAEKEAEKKG